MTDARARALTRARNDALRALTEAGAPVSQDVRDAVDQLVARVLEAAGWPRDEVTPVRPSVVTPAARRPDPRRWWRTGR